jgi:hypothetical protein
MSGRLGAHYHRVVRPVFRVMRMSRTSNPGARKRATSTTRAQSRHPTARETHSHSSPAAFLRAWLKRADPSRIGIGRAEPRAFASCSCVLRTDDNHCRGRMQLLPGANGVLSSGLSAGKTDRRKQRLTGHPPREPAHDSGGRPLGHGGASTSVYYTGVRVKIG